MTNGSSTAKWFWTFIDRCSNVISILSALGLTLIGLSGGLIDLVFKFSPVWRVITLLGLSALILTFLAVIVGVVRRRQLLRRVTPTAGSTQAASTTFRMEGPVSDMAILGSMAEGIDTFFHSTGPVQGLRADSNIHRAASEQPSAIHRPIVLDQDGLRNLVKSCQETSRELHQFLLERERDRQQYDNRREDLPWEDYINVIKRQHEDTMNLYRQRFSGRALALLEIATDNGYGDLELVRHLRGPVNTIELDRIADRLSAVAERVRFSNPDLDL